MITIRYETVASFDADVGETDRDAVSNRSGDDPATVQPVAVVVWKARRRQHRL